MEENLCYEKFGMENNPNADVLIYALQHIGYKNDVAICDIIDNSIDADATKIILKISTDRIIIADNGFGMDYQTLDQALRLGSDVPKDRNINLGKFGMGLSTASLSLCEKVTVLTKKSFSNHLLKSVTDIEVIKKNNKFLKFIGDANSLDQELFEELLPDETNGTIIILENCHGIKNKNIVQFENKMIKVISRIYRKFMEKISFVVNEKNVKPTDPLMLDEKETKIYSDEKYEVKWKIKNGEEQKAIISVKLAILPEYSQEINKEKEINMVNQGFSIIRNNREIAYGIVPSGWFTRHNVYNRFRAELSFEGEMDEAMGVNFTKNGIDIVDSVEGTLKRNLIPQITQIGKELKKNTIVKDNEDVNHGEAEEVISKKSQLLIIPKTKDSNGEQQNKEKENVHTNIKHSTNAKRTNANVRFELKEAGRTGAIFDAWLEGKTVVIQWNVEHPFYERFVIEHKDDKTLISSVDFLIYSLASAQIQAIGDDDKKKAMIENIISVMSSNMRTLLG